MKQKKLMKEVQSEISEDKNSDESYETPLQVEEQREEVSNNQGSNESNNFAFPSCWNQIIWVKKKKQYPWLTCKNSKLGCTVCRDLPSLGIHSKKGIHLSQEWQLSEITASGHTKEKQLTSLRNKIKKHKESKAHIEAEKIKLQSEKQSIENGICEMNKSRFSATEKLFRIAYKIAKTGRPFTDLPIDCDIHMLNGVDIGRTLQSDKSCHNICDHIGNEMRTKLCKIIIDSKSKISVLIDEATSFSKKSGLIVYIKTCLPESLNPVTFLLDLRS